MSGVIETYRTWAEISREALRHNVCYVQERVGAGVQVMAVVKANAYGHGAAEVAEAVGGLVSMFGVANAHEAAELQTYTGGKPILVLGPALPSERAEIVRAGFLPSVSSVAEAEAYGALAAEVGHAVPVHVVLDTGMGRIGIWQEEALAELARLQAVPDVRIAGLASHLPSADEDAKFTMQQLAEFHRLAREIVPQCAGGAPLVHVENSAGALGFPAQAGDLVRMGLALYGSSPLPEFQQALQPALTWKTRITLVREVGAGRTISYGRTYTTPRAMRIGTLAVGYADGYNRHLTHQGAEVLVGGQRCALLGRVTMDQILVDLSAVPEACEGDEVVLMGRQGGQEILAAELAQKAGTIPWEIFTGLGHRVVRCYA